MAVAASPEDGYRMRARLHVRGARFGFFREGTHDLCDARATRQLLPATLDTLDRLMAGIRSIGATPFARSSCPRTPTAANGSFTSNRRADCTPRLLEKLLAIDGLTPGPYVTDRSRLATRR